VDFLSKIKTEPYDSTTVTTSSLERTWDEKSANLVQKTTTDEILDSKRVGKPSIDGHTNAAIPSEFKIIKQTDIGINFYSHIFSSYSISVTDSTKTITTYEGEWSDPSSINFPPLPVVIKKIAPTSLTKTKILQDLSKIKTGQNRCALGSKNMATIIQTIPNDPYSIPFDTHVYVIFERLSGSPLDDVFGQPREISDNIKFSG